MGNSLRVWDRGPHSVGFKYRDEFAFKSKTGGCLSILTICAIIALIVYIFIKVFAKQQIIATRKENIDRYANYVQMPIGKGMIWAIGVQQLDLRYERIFDFRLSRTKITKGERNIQVTTPKQTVELVPCTAKHFRQSGLENQYKNLEMYKMLCVNQTEILKLNPNEGYRFEVERCSQNDQVSDSSFSVLKYQQESFQKTANSFDKLEEYNSNKYDFWFYDKQNLPPDQFFFDNLGEFTNWQTYTQQYWINQKRCEIANCYQCDETNQKCLQCSSGYFLGLNGICYLTTKTCPQNCQTCYSDGQVCITCKSGSSLYNNGSCLQLSYNCQTTFCIQCYSGTQICVSCTTGYVPDSNGSCVSRCKDPNCSQCDESGNDCTTCKSGYAKFTDGNCLLKSYSCSNISNCYQCFQGKQYCIKCSSSFQPSTSGKCVSSCGDVNCMICNENGTCSTCNDGYSKYTNETCLKQIDNCTDSNCYKCLEKTSYCIYCGYGYTSVNGTCQWRCNDLNCDTCDQTGSTCSYCKYGYGLYRNGTCLQTTYSYSCAYECNACFVNFYYYCASCWNSGHILVDGDCKYPNASESNYYSAGSNQNLRIANFKEVGNNQTSQFQTPKPYKNLQCMYSAYQKTFPLPRKYTIQFYHLDTMIHQQNPEFKKAFINQRYFAVQLRKDTILRYDADLSFDTYEVTTNRNLFWSAQLKAYKDVAKGLIADQMLSQAKLYQSNAVNVANSDQNKLMDNFLTLDITKSDAHIVASRRYRNALQALGQLGGQMSILFFILGFVVGGYNQFLYNVTLSKKIYYKKQNQPIDIKVNPWTYIKYNCYVLKSKIISLIKEIILKIKKMCCCCFKKNEDEQNQANQDDKKRKLTDPNVQDWQLMVQKSSNILDIETTLKKINHLEKACLAILGEQKFKALYFQQPHHLEFQEQLKQTSEMHTILTNKYKQQNKGEKGKPQETAQEKNKNWLGMNKKQETPEEAAERTADKILAELRALASKNDPIAKNILKNIQKERFLIIKQKEKDQILNTNSLLSQQKINQIDL